MALDDPHIRQEVLSNIVEGAVMGAVVCLKGPAATVNIANAGRSRNGEQKANNRSADARRLQSQHDFLMQILMTIQSCKGFVVIVASARNPVLAFHLVRTSISVLSLAELDIHSCRWIGIGDSCHSLHVATNFALAGSKAIAPSTHVEGCDQAIALKVKTRGFKRDRRPHVGAHDTGTGLKDLGKVVMLLSLIHI